MQLRQSNAKLLKYEPNSEFIKLKHEAAWMMKYEPKSRIH